MQTISPTLTFWFGGIGGAAAIAIIGPLIKRFFDKRGEKGTQTTIHSQMSSVGVADSQSIAIVAAPVTASQMALGQNITQTSTVHHHHSVEDHPRRPDFTNSKPTPAQIGRELNAVLPYDRPVAQHKYEGLAVTWRVNFFLFNLNDGASVVANYWDDQGGFCQMDVSFSMTEVPPELKGCKDGTPFWVKGKIERVSPYTVYLESDPTILAVEHP